jgi:hypothetical protein
MRHLLYIFLFISFASFSQGKYQLLTTIETQAGFFTTDNQCSIYTVKGNELTKYDKTGKLLYKYSNKKYGNISSVDASNMLRVLVFYKDFSSVVFLDNTLTETADPLNLSTLGFTQISLVSASYNSNMWLFDQSAFSLLYYKDNITDYTLAAAYNLNQLMNDSLQPNLMIDYNNKVYLNNPKSGIIIFDNYGTYYKTIPVKGLSAFQPIGEWVYYAAGKKIKAYNIKTTEEKEFNVPADFRSFRLETDILVLQDEKSISLYMPR